MLRWFEWFSVVSCMALGSACGTETPTDLIPDGGANDGGSVGNASGCVPATCASLGYTCGAAGDGCGGVLSCGSCAPGDVCGGAGYNLCGGPGSGCPKATCQSLGYDCGPAGDGCGGLLQCGSCTSPSTCGGGGQASNCGPGGPCTGLCKQQVACSNGVLTTLSGVVLAGTDPALYGAPDPVPNVVVYVPNAPLTPFTRGVQCSQCGADVSGAPLVSTRTAYDGSFTLSNVPVGTGIPVVIQLGRWRRTFHIDVTQACAVTSVPRG